MTASIVVNFKDVKGNSYFVADKLSSSAYSDPFEILTAAQIEVGDTIRKETGNGSELINLQISIIN